MGIKEVLLPSQIEGEEKKDKWKPLALAQAIALVDDEGKGRLRRGWGEEVLNVGEGFVAR